MNKAKYKIYFTNVRGRWQFLKETSNFFTAHMWESRGYLVERVA